MTVSDVLPAGLVHLEAERAILGAALLEPDAAHLVADQDPMLFHSERHRLVARAVRRLVERGDPVDLVTVQAELVATGHLDEVDGPTGLAILVESGTVFTQLEPYLDVVRELATRRALLRLGREITGRAANPGEWPTPDLIAYTTTELLALEAGRRGDAVVTPDRLAGELGTFARTPGLQTGISLIDDLCDGLKPGHLVVLAGRPGLGKTAMAVQMARHLAVTQRYPLLFMSLEMMRAEIGLRLLSLETEASVEALRQYTPSDLDQAASVLASSGFHIVDEGAPQLAAIHGHVRRAVVQHRIVVAVVDHLGKVRVGRRESRYVEVGEVAQGLKALAKQFQIPVVALCQLNRLVERRNSPRPQLADLRDSGNVEEEADAVLFLWTAEERSDGKALLPVSLTLAKNRHGPTGERAYLFQRALGRFVDQSFRPEPRA